MNAQNISSRFLTGFLLTFLCALPFFMNAQTEAQAGNDVLEIQKVRSGRTTLLEPGDAIRYPVQKGDFNVEEKADVISVEGDNEIVVRNRSGENEMVNLKLDELRYFRQLNRTKLTVGWILLGLGLLVKLVVSISLFAVLLASSWGPLLAVVTFFLVFLFEYFSPLIIAAGILFISKGRRRIFKPKWSWKRKRLSKAK